MTHERDNRAEATPPGNRAGYYFRVLWYGVDCAYHVNDIRLECGDPVSERERMYAHGTASIPSWRIKAIEVLQVGVAQQ